MTWRKIIIDKPDRYVQVEFRTWRDVKIFNPTFKYGVFGSFEIGVTNNVKKVVKFVNQNNAKRFDRSMTSLDVFRETRKFRNELIKLKEEKKTYEYMVPIFEV